MQASILPFRTAFSQALGTQPACARSDHCPPERIIVREIYGSAHYVVFDLLSAGYGTTTPPPKASVDALIASARSLPVVAELLSFPMQPGMHGAIGMGEQPPVTLFNRDGPTITGQFGTAGTALAILGLTALVLLIALAAVVAIAKLRSGGGGRGRRGPSSSSSRGSSYRNGGSGLGKHEKLAQMEDDFLDDFNDDGMSDEEEMYSTNGGNSRRMSRRSRDSEEFELDDVRPAMKPKPAPASRPPPARPPAPPPPPPPDVSFYLREMPLRVSLEGDEEIELSVPMSRVFSTEEMLHAAFDACAETVGMELEAANKTITLRFVTRDGRERKLNTKSSWEELREARCVMIRLQSVGGTR